MIFQKDIKEWINPISQGQKIKHLRVYNIFFSHKKNILTLLLFLFFCLNFSQAQVRKDLEDRRKRLLRQIELTSKLLNKTTKNRAAALDRYVTLRKQIQKRELLVKTLREEIRFTQLSIDRAKNVVEALSNDIERLEEEYGELLRQAYRRKKNNNTFAFIFSAENLNQSFQRWQYLKQYDAYRKKQANLILETKATLTNKKNLLERTKIEKEELIISAEKQTALLSAELGDKSKLLRSLKKDEKRLKKELRKKQSDHERLNNAIEKVIRADMAARRKKERQKKRKNEVNKKPSPSKSTLARLSGDFKKNRGRLPMPVKNGIVTKRFGKQPHPTLPKIQITNNGIDIRTERNADVFAIFEGKVVSKQFIPGYQNMLIIQHGEYYTVYSNLESVTVKKGETVGTMDKIGVVAMNRKSNVSEVHFEVWRDKVRLNPEDWVK